MIAFPGFRFSFAIARTYMRCFVTHVGCHGTAHTCFMPRNCMCSYCSYHARMGWGVGVVACVVVSHMLDATELHIHVSCYATACARTVRIMHGWVGGGVHGGGGRGRMRCLVTHVGCYGTAHTCFMLRNCICTHMLTAISQAVL